jgi:hypothetical protein
MAEPAPAPMAEPVAEEAPADEEASPIAGWFRIDTDLGSTQLWAGATHTIGSLALATDIYVVGANAEFDIGPALTVGSATLTPMLGVVFNFGAQNLASIVPQFYAIVPADSIYFESWTQLFLSDMFNPATDYVHLRNFLLYNVSDVVGIGLEVDANINIANAPLKASCGGDPTATPPVPPTCTDKLTLAYLPVGPHIKLAYGPSAYLELFAGFDIAAKDAGRDKLAGRFTFVKNW